MMRLFNEQSVEDIADEVREQRGVTDTYTIAELRTAIHNAIEKYKQNNPTNTVNDGVLTNSYDVPLLGLKIKGNTIKASGYIPILPNDTTQYPIRVGDTFAVRNGNTYGYFNPITQAFTLIDGMTGDDIQRCEYVTGNNDVYCSTDYYLTGDDTLRIKFRVSSASNIGGSFVSSSANNNYCLYAGTSTSGWYMRYDGGNNRDFSGTRDWVEMEATPTGWSANGSSGSWAQKEFTSTSPMYIGYLYASSSPKIIGDMAYFEVAGKHKYLPVKVGSEYKMFDVLDWEFPTQNGTWDGGAVIIEDIPFPVGSTPSVRLQSVGNVEGNTYVIPIEVTDGTNTNDINIYIDEQLRKVGDVADYIEFGEHYKLTKSVTLDAGTRTLSDAKANSDYVCDKQSDGTLDGQVITVTSNNTTVVYELATPVEVVINFDKFKAYDGMTAINVNTEIEPSSIEAEYITKVGV